MSPEWVTFPAPAGSAMLWFTLVTLIAFVAFTTLRSNTDLFELLSGYLSDYTVLPPDTLEWFLRSLHTLLVSAPGIAQDPRTVDQGSRTHSCQAGSCPRWSYLGLPPGCWINPSTSTSRIPDLAQAFAAYPQSDSSTQVPRSAHLHGFSTSAVQSFPPSNSGGSSHRCQSW